MKYIDLRDTGRKYQALLALSEEELVTIRYAITEMIPQFKMRYEAERKRIDYKGGLKSAQYSQASQSRTVIEEALVAVRLANADRKIGRIQALKGQTHE